MRSKNETLLCVLIPAALLCLIFRWGFIGTILIGIFLVIKIRANKREHALWVEKMETEKEKTRMLRMKQYPEYTCQTTESDLSFEEQFANFKAMIEKECGF